MPQKAADSIRSLMKELEKIFGEFKISDEENEGREEIFWRLVRPHQSSDIGPLHADGWFWDFGHGHTLANVERVNILENISITA